MKHGQKVWVNREGFDLRHDRTHEGVVVGQIYDGRYMVDVYPASGAMFRALFKENEVCEREAQ